MSRLLALMEAKLGGQLPAGKPALRLVPASTPRARTLDPITRESHLRMIRHLRNRYGLQLLVDQATFGRGGLDQLEDDEVCALHADLHRAMECIRDGVSWEDAGLIRDVSARRA